METYSDSGSDSDYCSEDDVWTRCERCCLPPNYFHHASSDLGWRSQLMTCPSCRSVVFTRVLHERTPRTWLLSALLTPLGCCWLPWQRNWYCMSRHYCPLCEAYIGLARTTTPAIRRGSS